MGKSVHNDVLDQTLAYIQTNAEYVTACTAEPTTFAEVTTYKVGRAAVSSGDWTIADGDVSGRKVTLVEKTGVAVDSAGTVTHLAVTDDSVSKLLSVLTTDSRVITGNDSMKIPTFDLELRDPT